MDKKINFRSRMKKTAAMVLAAAMVTSSLSYMPPMEAQAAAQKVTKITMSSSKLTIYKGQKKTLKVKAAPKAAKFTAKWKSSNKRVAKVNSRGLFPLSAQEPQQSQLPLKEKIIRP